ncbi:hypothetical protein AB0F91_33930 [Amycolatopsis sp. NPDC023774]|uniref:hypothetical protein n=1 Tax=Amycolatopsis sp. NPDC023774 TaxID=3155015 RepID=UPI0033E36E7A
MIGSADAAVFGTGGAAADVHPAAGDQPLTTPTADDNRNGTRDIDEVLDSALIGGIGKFTAKSFQSGTDYDAGINAAKTVTNAQTENRKIVVSSPTASRAVMSGSLSVSTLPARIFIPGGAPVRARRELCTVVAIAQGMDHALQDPERV